MEEALGRRRSGLCDDATRRIRKAPARERGDGRAGARPAPRHRVSTLGAANAMTWVAFSFLLTGVLLNAGAQLLLKAGTNALGVITLTREDWLGQFGRMAIEPHVVGGIACYAVSVVVWIIGLSRVPVSIAYPMLSLGYIVNAIAAHY